VGRRNSIARCTEPFSGRRSRSLSLSQVLWPGGPSVRP
jgi:hypothetical protein